MPWGPEQLYRKDDYVCIIMSPGTERVQEVCTPYRLAAGMSACWLRWPDGSRLNHPITLQLQRRKRKFLFIYLSYIARGPSPWYWDVSLGALITYEYQVVNSSKSICWENWMTLAIHDTGYTWPVCSDSIVCRYISVLHSLVEWTPSEAIIDHISA